MTWLTHISSFDILILLIFLFMIVRGFWTGFVRQIAFIAAMVLGFVIVGHFHEIFYQYIKPFINNLQIAFLISYITLFVVIYYVVILVGLGLKMVMDAILLGWFDRLIGGVVGAAKALFISSLLFMALSGLLASSNSFLRKSFSYPYLSHSSEYILQFIKDHNLRSRFKLKEPAIKPEPLVERIKEVRDENPGKKETAISRKSRVYIYD